MRYSDISQVIKEQSIEYKEIPFDDSFFAPTRMFIEKQPNYTLNLTYMRFQQVEIDESLFSHFNRFEDHYWNTTISHPLYEYPSKEVIDACIQEDNKKLEEYNKRHSNRCNCSKCIHYNGSREKYIKCSAIAWHELREKTKDDSWNCDKFERIEE